MKKQILNLGKALNKAEQKEINGGYMPRCYDGETCAPGYFCYVPLALCITDDYCDGVDEGPIGPGPCL
ncbi:MAG: hypothetical protein JKY44_03440 [Flavobacteriaceae bacterium]|nr:hypothetical protein [Flavobacteriaceae bacterium]